MAEREKNDWYPTPFKATEKLLQVEDLTKLYGNRLRVMALYLWCLRTTAIKLLAAT